jgi:acetylornithine deacetylase/succinyl-diaminopimelate desuccinylase-like protein
LYLNTPSEKQQLKELNFNEKNFFQDLGMSNGNGEHGFSTLERLWFRPTFEINGIWGGYTEKGFKTVLPSKAFAKISMRLVPDQEPEEISAAVKQFFLKNVSANAKLKFHEIPGSGRAVISPTDSPAVKAAQKALSETYENSPVLVRNGASIPIVADLKNILGIDSLLIGYSLPDCKIHSPDENLHLPTFFKGIKSLIRMYNYLGESRN